MYCGDVVALCFWPVVGTTLSRKTLSQDYYGVATISRLLKITGLFCKSALQKRRYSAKETYNFKEPTHRSHPIVSYYGVATFSRINKISDLFRRI